MDAIIQTDPARSLYFLRDDVFMSLNRRLDPPPRTHIALQMVIALDDRPHAIRLGNDEWRKAHIHIIESNVPFTHDACAGVQSWIQINPLSTLAAGLRRHYLKGQRSAHIRLSSVERALQQPLTLSTIQPDHVFSALTEFQSEIISANRADRSCIHPRLQPVLRQLQHEPQEDLSLRTLAQSAHLSESHLAALFKQQTGLPLRRAVLWFRTRAAVFRLVANGGDVTDAAHSAGFADTAHFSRTLRQLCGSNPSSFSKNHQFFQDPAASTLV